MTTVMPRKSMDLPAAVSDAAGHPAWASDLVLDMLRLLEVDYAALLPGSSFRGIHDSGVNYTANRQPEMILCGHEMITVAMARGYAKVTGRPMAAIVHDLVGLLNTSMTVYDAWCDRVPVLVLGGGGPMDAAKRRPWIDWIHTANLQGMAVRDFTKWDDQPSSVEAIPESILRAYRIAITEPAGPVYLCFDVDLQEQPLAQPFPLPDAARYRAAPSPEPDRAALREAARLLVGAELPLAFADRVGRSASAVRALVELAELLAMPVVNLGARQSFPTPHALDFAGGTREVAEGDVILALDLVDLSGALASLGGGTDRKVINVSLDELLHRGFSADYQKLPPVDLPLLASPAATLPLLLEECRSLLDSGARGRIELRRRALEGRQERLRAQQLRYVKERWEHPQITEARLSTELWRAVEHEDFFLTGGRAPGMAPGVWHVAGPEQSAAGGGGGAVGAGPGVALGAALALKDEGKLPLAVMGDGEFLASLPALWTAAHYRIPSLWVINNNRSYFNDEAHQDRVALIRERPPENKWIAMRLENPEIDYASVARGFDVEGIGPVKSAADLADAYQRGVEAVKRGQLAVVDVWTENRERG